jgi:hypothetical protein
MLELTQFIADIYVGTRVSICEVSAILKLKEPLVSRCVFRLDLQGVAKRSDH